MSIVYYIPQNLILIIKAPVLMALFRGSSFKGTKGFRVSIKGRGAYGILVRGSFSSLGL